MVNIPRELYPFTGSYFHVDGIAMHYLDEGSGDPVIMLHGNPTWSFFYRNLVLNLRSEFRAVVPDHIGCGMSDKPDDKQYEYSLRRRVSDLEQLLDHLKIRDNITLVMHDWGGMIGMAYATKYPDRISRLVMLNTAAFHLPPTKKLPASLWLCRNTPLDDFLIRRSGLFCRLIMKWCSCRGLSEDVKEAYLLPYRSAANRLGQLRFVQDIPLRPTDRSYALVSEVQSKLEAFRKKPVLILWGEKDFVFDRHFLDAWREKLPLAEIHSFPKAGHLILEDAGDETTLLIKQFFNRYPSQLAK